MLLTAPGKPVHPSDSPNIESISEIIIPADVILVSGTARISYVVKILTVSAWSHAVLYVGDKSALLSDTEKEEWTNLYGKECIEHLVIDADPMMKVHLRPLHDYRKYMLRHCRAEALTKNDAKAVVNYALSQTGKSYDIKHIFRLMLFFTIPWELLPQGFRRFAGDFSLSEQDTICSRVIAEAFESVGYPIRPTYIEYGQGKISRNALRLSKGLKTRGLSAFRLLRGGKAKKAINRLVSERYTEIHLRGVRHVTPSDYDLSRFFSIIKNPDDLDVPYQNAKPSCKIEY